MAAYTQQGAAVQTGGFGSVAPSAVNPNDAFDMLQKAFKTGLLQSAEINNALNVIPAQQRGQIAAANDAVAEAEMNARLRPQIEPLKVEEARLRNKELSIKIDDPLGLKQYAAKELLQIGQTPSGDVAKDMATLNKWTQDKQIKEKKLAALATLQTELVKNDIQHEINLDSDPDDEIAKARQALADGRAKKEAKEKAAKYREALEKEALSLGISPTESVTLTDAELGARIAQKNAEAEAKKSAVKPTEAQNKNTAFVAEMEAANQVIDGLEAEGFAPSTRGQTAQAVGSSAPALRWLANKATPEKELAWTAAKNKWIEAVLRNRSGAAISQSEYRNADLQYFAQPGDTPEVVANKKALRQAAFAAMRSTLPESLIGKADSASGTTPPATAAPAPATPVTSPSAGPIPPPNVRTAVDRRTGQKHYVIPDPANPGKFIVTDASGNPLP